MLAYQGFSTNPHYLEPGAQIQAGLGIAIADVQASEVVLVGMMPDDSGSTQFGGNAQAVRGGHNAVLDALGTSQQQGNIFVHTRYLNGFVLYPYCALAQAVRMDTRNYNPNPGTPLFDQAIASLVCHSPMRETLPTTGYPWVP